MEKIQKRRKSGHWDIYISHGSKRTWYHYEIVRNGNMWVMFYISPIFDKKCTGNFATKKNAVAHAENRELVLSGQLQWRVGQ